MAGRIARLILLLLLLGCACAVSQPQTSSETGSLAASKAYTSPLGFSVWIPDGWQRIADADLEAWGAESGLFEGWEIEPSVEVGFSAPTDAAFTFPYVVIMTQRQRGQPTLESLIREANDLSGGELEQVIRDANPDREFPHEFRSNSAFCRPHKGVLGMTTSIRLTEGVSVTVSMTMHYGVDILVVIYTYDLDGPRPPQTEELTRIHESLVFDPEVAYTGASAARSTTNPLASWRLWIAAIASLLTIVQWIRSSRSRRRGEYGSATEDSESPPTID